MKKQTYTSMLGFDQPRLNALTHPREVFANQLQLPIIESTLSKTELTRWTTLSALRIELGLLYYLLLLNGCRVSELLSLRGNDINTRGNIIIKGKKGSGSRMIVTNGYETFLQRKMGSPCLLFLGLNYNNVYRKFIENGIIMKGGKNERNIVTHAPRYAFVTMLQQQNKSIEESSEIIGHKSSKNTLRYQEKAKRRK